VVGTTVTVGVGLKLPQGELLHVTDQLTSGLLLGSLLMVTAICVVLPAFNEVGGPKFGVKARLMLEVMVIVA